MTARIFVDTNVLVYFRDGSAGQKQRQSAEWIKRLWRTLGGRLSMQVIHEFYATVTRKLNPPVEREDARRDVRELMAWHPRPLDAALLNGGWKVQDSHNLSFWDALIVAAAQSAACDYLLTEDLQDGQSFDGLVVVNPFLHEPTSLRQ